MTSPPKCFFRVYFGLFDMIIHHCLKYSWRDDFRLFFSCHLLVACLSFDQVVDKMLVILKKLIAFVEI